MPITFFLYEQKNITIGVFFTLVVKIKKIAKRRHAAAWICHAAACLEFSFFTLPYHAATWPTHAVACWPLVFGWQSPHAAA